MIRIEYKGYIICNAQPTGGKAGTGYNKTTTIQVRDEAGASDGYYFLKKQFRYPTHDNEKKLQTIEKAKKFVDNLIA